MGSSKFGKGLTQAHDEGWLLLPVSAIKHSNQKQGNKRRHLDYISMFQFII